MNLSTIGITLQTDGTLSLNGTTLRNQLETNYDKVMTLFQEETYGFATLMNQELSRMTDSINGTLQIRQNGIQAVVQDIDSRIAAYTLRLEGKETQLQKKFAALEVALADMQSQSSFLASQLDNINYAWSSGRR